MTMRSLPFLLQFVLVAGLFLVVFGAGKATGGLLQVTHVNTYSDICSSCETMYVVHNYMYIPGGSDSDGALTLTIVDISNITTPEVIGKLSSSESGISGARTIKVVGDYAYLDNYDDSGFSIVNISNPTNLSVVGSYESVLDVSGGRGIDVSGDYVCFTSRDGYLSLIDVSDPTNPEAIMERYIGGFPWNVVIYGDYAYVADRTGPIKVYDILDELEYVSEYSLGLEYVSEYSLGGVWDVDIIDWPYVFVTTNDYVNGSGYAIVDISDPYNLKSVSRNSVDQEVQMASIGNKHVSNHQFAFLSSPNEGSIIVIDISDPTKASIVTTQYENTIEVFSYSAYPYGLSVVSDDNEYQTSYVYYGKVGLLHVLTLKLDRDRDGVADVDDPFPSDPDELADTDGDGVGDNGDDFPYDLAASVDSDGDGRPDEWNTGKSQVDSTTGLYLDEFPHSSQLNSWWQILLSGVVIASGAVATYKYNQYTIAQRISNKKGELRGRIAELKEKGIKTNKLESILEED